MSSLGNQIILTEEDVPGAKLLKPAVDCSVIELKRWLECHGEKRTGKKRDLIQRVEGCLSIQKKVDLKVDGGKWYAMKASKLNLNTQGALQDESSQALCTDWKMFPSQDIPAMYNYGHLYHYLVESLQNEFLDLADEDKSDSEGSGTESSGTATAKPLKKGRNLLKSGFVENIQDNGNSKDYFARAHVHHSMRKEYPLSVQVKISKGSGFVQHASCNCIARSLGRCAHVDALLLFINDYSSEHGHMVQVPKTSEPCSWNRGKKRQKNPKPLHEAEYKPSEVPKKTKLYNWDPRPAKYHGKVDEVLQNTFVTNLQSYSAGVGEISMWETVLAIKYSDFDLEDADLSILRLLVRKFKENLQEQSDKLCGEHESSCQVPGTEDQSKSETWFAERWPRVTASKCHYLVSLWNAVLAFKVEAKQRCFKFLYERLWFKQNICTADMKYGIDAEPAARDAYVKATDNTVTETGLWINKMYPHLGASPDGLVVDKESGTAGILEIKCLKLLKTRTVEEVISGWKDCTIPKETLQRQCFKLESDGLIHLKRSHGYYFQIQLQLLVTGGHFCDFVLFPQKGPPSIERFYPESGIQMQIIKATSEFWEKVLVPEYFLMKVPRGLLPVILD
ncbi:uncharacterized protein LOC5510867 [Nematostella vectensis]|uniref:uncharacterized protein LOC5510867 n=1 Tax=Nematostella vectensis TaxID=45351 RepID=UPI0020778134|nr:uncharacterized protein LOC5510867 [Nematostella vectensis]